MKRPRRVAVVGVGSMGQNHLRVYSMLKDVSVVGVADVNGGAAKPIADKYNTRFFPDYRALFAKLKPDAVSVVVPTNLHYEVAAFFIKQGVDVLVEKPIASTMVQAMKLAKLLKSSQSFVTVGHIERFNPAVVKAKALVKQGRIGQILAINAKRVGVMPSRMRGADVLVDIGIHDVDIANYLLEEYPKRVRIHRSFNKTGIGAYAAELLMEYTSASALIQVNWLTPIKIRNLAITGTRGYLELDYIAQSITLYQQPKVDVNFVGDFNRSLQVQAKKIDLSTTFQEPLKVEIMAFLSKSPKAANVADAIQALKVCVNKL